jgi:hypothetical protein
MTLIYQTEYRLGRRGACVTRSYGGVRAVVAIAADLTLALIFGVFGLAFGVIGWTLWLVWHFFRLVFIALRDILLSLGRFVRAVITLPWQASRRQPSPLVNKPAWASFDEL